MTDGPFVLHACCVALESPQTCAHRELFLKAVEFVRAEGVFVGYAPAGSAADDWLVSRSHPAHESISVFPTAFRLYGWDVLTSVLIHEYGHIKLYQAERWCDAQIETEVRANEYGKRHTPMELLP